MENKFLLTSGPLHRLFLLSETLSSPFSLTSLARSSSPFESWLPCHLLRKPSAGSHSGLYCFLCHVFPAGISCEHPKGRSPSWESRCCPSGWGPSFSEATFFAEITHLVTVPAQTQACLTPGVCSLSGLRR